MCFLLFAGTTKPLPRKKWDKDAPDISVEPLAEGDAPVRTHFTNPEVQCVGSTSGCGCDFPNAMLQNEEWPFFEDTREDVARDRYNQQALVNLLRATGEKIVELYGIWEEILPNHLKSGRAFGLPDSLTRISISKSKGFTKSA